MDNLVNVWENFSAHQVYRADSLSMGISGARWVSTLAVGWLTRNTPRSLLDNSPLRALVRAPGVFSSSQRILLPEK